MAERAVNKEMVVQLSEQMFANVSQYIQAEMLVTKDDYKLLENMNRMSKQKYSDMSYLAENANTLNASLQEKYESFQPFLEQIDQIDQSVSILEQATREIDEYSKRLEAKFKKISAK